MLRIDKDSVVLSEEELAQIKEQEYKRGFKIGRNALANIVREQLDTLPEEDTKKEN